MDSAGSCTDRPQGDGGDHPYSCDAQTEASKPDGIQCRYLKRTAHGSGKVYGRNAGDETSDPGYTRFC